MSDNQTQQPTAKRRQLARQEGRVVASSQVVGVVIWLALALGSFWMGGAVLTLARQGTQSLWGQTLHLEATDVGEQLRQAFISLWIFVIPVSGTILGLAIFARLLQVGVVWAPSRVAPEVKRLNPGQRIGSLLSADKLLQFVRSAGLVICILSSMGFGIWSQRDALIGLVASGDFQAETIRLVAGCGLRLGGCLAVFAAADYAYQRYRFEMSLQMSPEEVRAEVQEVQANPQVAAKRRGFQRELRGRNDNDNDN